jgi:hypothetical protein
VHLHACRCSVRMVDCAYFCGSTVDLVVGEMGAGGGFQTWRWYLNKCEREKEKYTHKKRDVPFVACVLNIGIRLSTVTYQTAIAHTRYVKFVVLCARANFVYACSARRAACVCVHMLVYARILCVYMSLHI